LIVTQSQKVRHTSDRQWQMSFPCLHLDGHYILFKRPARRKWVRSHIFTSNRNLSDFNWLSLRNTVNSSGKHTIIAIQPEHRSSLFLHLQLFLWISVNCSTIRNLRITNQVCSSSCALTAFSFFQSLIGNYAW
jgi:hypothetical protein